VANSARSARGLTAAQQRALTVEDITAISAPIAPPLSTEPTAAPTAAPRAGVGWLAGRAQRSGCLPLLVMPV